GSGSTSYSQASITGSVNLGGAALLATLSFNSAVSNQFIIIDNDGTDPVIGMFNGLPEGAIFMIGPSRFEITYQGGDGNDVVLTKTGYTAASQIGGIVKLGNGSMQINGSGVPGVSYAVQGNFDLSTTNWLDLGGIPADPTGLLQFIDTDAPNHSKRFYRFIA